LSLHTNLPLSVSLCDAVETWGHEVKAWEAACTPGQVQVHTNQNHQADLVELEAAAAAVAEDLHGEEFVTPVHSDTWEKDP
jgi:hypothetical protein